MTTCALAAVITLPACTNSPQATGLDPIYRRKEVQYDTREKPGTIVINPSEHFLYFVEGGGRAVRYGVGVGSEGFAWSGVATVRSKQEWPNWYPTNDYLQRQPAARSRLNLAERIGNGGWTCQSTWRPRAVFVARQQRHPLSDSRHQRTLDHRPERFLRLYSPHQRRCY